MKKVSIDKHRQGTADAKRYKKGVLIRDACMVFFRSGDCNLKDALQDAGSGYIFTP